jgi:AcrR family transcriptional regulator
LSRHFIEVVEPLIAGGERYADLSVERIIKAGAVSRATFYVYFQDKGDLLRAMAQDVIQDLFQAGNSWWALPPDARGPDGPYPQGATTGIGLRGPRRGSHRKVADLDDRARSVPVRQSSRRTGGQQAG